MNTIDAADIQRHLDNGAIEFISFSWTNGVGRPEVEFEVTEDMDIDLDVVYQDEYDELQQEFEALELKHDILDEKLKEALQDKEELEKQITQLLDASDNKIDELQQSLGLANHLIKQYEDEAAQPWFKKIF